MDCSSEPGVIAALLRGARAATRTLAALALGFASLLHAAETAETTISQFAGGATWSLHGETSLVPGGTYTYTITHTAGTQPDNEYAGFHVPSTSTSVAHSNLGSNPMSCGTGKYFCASFSPSEIPGIWNNLQGHHTIYTLINNNTTITATFTVTADTPIGTTISFGAIANDGRPRSGGLLLTVSPAPTKPPDPTPPTLVSATTKTLTIEWTHQGDGGSPLVRDYVHYRVQGTTEWSNWYAGETPVTRAAIGGLQANTAYEVRVSVTNMSNLSSQWVEGATAFRTRANTPATGAPSITGTAAVGQDLTATTGTIADADGLPSSFSYQWVQVDADGTWNPVDIPGATDATYTLTDADMGKKIKVRVSFTDDLETTETLTSDAYPSGGTVTAAATAQVMGARVAPGNAQLVVTWTAVENATGYVVQWKSGSQGYNAGDRQATVTSGSTTRYTIPSLTSGTEYTVRVIATRTGANDGPPSAEVTGTPFTTPGAPLHLSGVPGDEQVTLTWDAPSSDGGSAILRYEYAIDDSGTWIDAGLDLEETVPGLTNGQRSTVAVRAVNAAGAGPATSVTATPATAQVMGARVAPGNAQLVVTWTAVENATGYVVQWKSGSQGYNAGDRQATVTSGSTTRYTIPSLTNGTEYTVRVIATRTGANDGPPSAEVTGTPFTTPGAPLHLSGVPGDEQVTLTWDAPSSDGGSAILRYEYAIDDSGTWIDAGLDLEETVPGLTNGQRSTVAVRAVNAAGAGPATSVTATPFTAPSVPETLTATAGDGEVVLEWTEPADDGGSPVTGYEYRHAAGSFVPEDTPWQDAGTELTATVTELENETRYAFEVRARNRTGPGAAARAMAMPILLVAELFSPAAMAVEGEALAIGVRRSGRLAFPAHAYIGVTDSALPGVTATDEGRDDGLGRHRLEFAAGADEATVTVTVAFDGVRREGRVLTATLESVEVEIDGVVRAYEFGRAELEVRVTDADAALSVADARADPESAELVFAVSLDRTRDVPVRVDYATEDGSARAGEDYTAVSGTLVIEAGRRETAVEVPALRAPHLTGERTLTLRLSNARNALIADGEATGTIARESELAQAWLARFGRTASDHTAQAIARRLAAGERETQVTVADRRLESLVARLRSGGMPSGDLLSDALPFGGVSSAGLSSGGGGLVSVVEDVVMRLAAPALAASGGTPGAFGRENAGEALRRATLPDVSFRVPTMEEALLGSSFYVGGGVQEAEGGGTWAAWGDVAATRFEGDANGLALDGDVITGTVGLDRRWRALLVGLALSRSTGDGAYGTGAGTIASTLTSVHPYVRYQLGERAQVWGAMGGGRGGLEITPGSGAALKADLWNSMAAAGARAVLRRLSRAESSLEIVLRSDLLWTETSSDETTALAEAVGTASRGRLLIEGAGQIQGLGGIVRPSVEGGVRYDGGDAETGAGFEVGGGLGWARGALTLEVNGRMLIAHADESYEEWGYSGSLVYEPGADGLGLQMRVGSSAGAAASGIRNLWALENASGLVRGGGMPFAQRFDAEVGYGIGSGTLWYPYFVADDSGRTRYGLKLSSGRTMGVGLEFGRRESVDLGPQDAMLLRGELRF